MSNSASVSFRVDNGNSQHKTNSSTSSKKVSVTFRIDKGVVEHNNRDFIAKNVIRERVSQNIVYKKEDLREKYHELFDKALKEYNEKQKRSDRKIADYYEHIKKSETVKPYYEAVVQIGDNLNCGYGTENFETAKKMLDEYMSEFEKRNPNIKVFNAVMHLDEATPHLHIDFVPIATNQKQGLSTRVSLKKALEQQGITSKSKKFSEWATWADAEKKIITSVMKKYDFVQEQKGAHYSHMTVDEYKNAKQKIEKLNQHINEIKQKPTAEISPDEIALIKNQNDFMRSEIEKRDEKIKILSKRAGAKFVPFEVYSQDKLQFICEELSRMNVQYVEENNILYIPEWAMKACGKVASKYQPIKSPSIKADIMNDIDTLIYSSENFDDLLSKLKEKGYEIKTDVKYIAVKAPRAQRFMRLKSFGEEYEPHNIEKRIAEKEKFPNAVQARSRNASELEQHFYTTITKTIIAVRQFRLHRPQRANPKKIYSFENDKEIDNLSQQLLTMRELGLNSRDRIYEAAEESQKIIDEKAQKVKQLSDEIPTLRSDIEQIKYYFSVMQSDNKLDSMQQIKIASAKETLKKYGIESEEDLNNIVRRNKLIPVYISNLKSEISDEQIKLGRISGVLNTYEKIISGGYVDGLIAAERERTIKEKALSDKKQGL